MKHIFMFLLLLLASIMFSGCIEDSSPKNRVVRLDPGKSQLFTAQSDSGKRLIWYLDGQEVATDINHFDYTAHEAIPSNRFRDHNHVLVVTEKSDRVTENDFSIWWIAIENTTQLSTACYLDGDGDGFGDPESVFYESQKRPVNCIENHLDCDDKNPAVYPDAEELCNQIDDDCNGQIDDGLAIEYYPDKDGDGFGSGAAVNACEQPQGYVKNDIDCNDGVATVHPSAREACNGVDDNCNGEIDEGINQLTFYKDADYDGFGNPAETISACEAPKGYVENNADCNDAAASIFPGAEETCNGVDDNCNSKIDEDTADRIYYRDSDGDGYGNAGMPMQRCDAPSGYVENDTDCDDAVATIYPEATEVCNGKDDDCDGQIDEGDAAPVTYYEDADGDGYGSASQMKKACSPPDGYTTDNSDCNDQNGQIHPGMAENCTTVKVDDNCNGQADEACENPDQLVRDGLNTLIGRLQTYMRSGETPNSVEDVMPSSEIMDIRVNYFEAALSMENNHPAAHLGLGVLALIQIAYDIDSVPIIEFLFSLLTGAKVETNDMAALIFETLDSGAADYLNNAMEHMNYAVNLDSPIVLSIYLPQVVTDAGGTPVRDTKTGLPQLQKDPDGNILFKAEISELQFDQTDARLIRSLLHLGLGGLHLYQAYDLNIADQSGSYDYFNDIEMDEDTGRVNRLSLVPLLSAIEYNDKRNGFLTLQRGGVEHTQAAKIDFLDAITETMAAIDELEAETDDQSDDIVTVERMVDIYSFLKNIDAFTEASLPEISLARLSETLQKAQQLVTSTNQNRFPFTTETPQGDDITVDINLSGFFNGNITNLHQYLPYHYWFTINETTVYPRDMIQITKNVINRRIGHLFGLRIPIPLNADTPASKLEDLMLFGYLSRLKSGLIGYSAINIDDLSSPEMTVILPDMALGGMLQGLTQQEVDAVMLPVSKRIFNQQ